MNECVNDDIWLASYVRNEMSCTYRKAYLHKIAVHCPRGHENEYECVSKHREEQPTCTNMFKCIN